MTWRSLLPLVVKISHVRNPCYSLAYNLGCMFYTPFFASQVTHFENVTFSVLLCFTLFYFVLLCFTLFCLSFHKELSTLCTVYFVVSTLFLRSR